MNNKKGREPAYDVMRVAAIMAVIIIHVSSQHIVDAFPSAWWEVSNICDSMVRWGVGVFFMISGALFLDLSRHKTTKELYMKNIFRLVKLFVLWSLLYALYAYAINPSMSAGKFMSKMVMGPYHFWFLKMMVGLYIITPILRKVVSDRRTERYFIIVTFVVAFITPWLAVLTGFYSHYAQRLFYYNMEDMGIGVVAPYVLYFVLGHYLSTYPHGKRNRHCTYVLGALGMVMTAVATHVVSHHSGAFSKAFFNNNSPFILFMAVAIFTFLFNRYHGQSHAHRSTVAALSRCTLGIYLVHVLVLNVFSDLLGVDSYTLHPVLGIPLLSLVVFALSLLVTVILLRIPIMKKLVQ